MPLPEPYLDDLRFQQDLVDEARKRIIHYCPEWTDYNLSDPGITLIELFAWMTEMMVYRLNRVPEKNYVKFLELMGMQLTPANSAKTEMTFWLSTPFPITPDDNTTAIVPQGTEVATRRTDEEDEVIFTTDDRLEIRPTKLTQLRQDDEFQKNYVPRLGVETFYAFGQGQIEQGDTFYIGFDENEDVRGHIMQLYFECEPTQATGIKREDPPLVWEAYIGNGQWQEVRPSSRPGEEDTTGGLNNEEGALALYLPITIQPATLRGRNAYWLRCRFEQRRAEQGLYTESPRILNMIPYTLGATTKATHALIVENEIVGSSNGDPGQSYFLENTPVLDLQEGETLEVEEDRYGLTSFVPWTRVDEFSKSDRFDRHYLIDTSTGEVHFGPAIRQPDGTVMQYGRIPESGRRFRFARYRYGGGTVGNVPTETLNVLKSSIAYVDRVSNLRRADGGRDAESLEEAKMRARRELRAQQRAVTAEDYEALAKLSSREVARVRTHTSGQNGQAVVPGMVDLLVVPAAFDSLEAGDLSKLQLDDELRRTISNHLDQYRLLTTTLRVREPNYVGIKVKAEIVVSEFSQPDSVITAVDQALVRFLSPLPLGSAASLNGGKEDGWPFGGELYISELDALIRNVPGVKHVWDIEVSQRAVDPGQESLADDETESNDSDLSTITERRIQIPSDTLLCSLRHTIEVVEQ